MSRIETNAKPWYIYILLCSKVYLYTGISPDVVHRVQMHRKGTGARFTKGKHPIDVVYIKKCTNYSEAAKLEIQIKSYAKMKKEKLIHEFNTFIEEEIQEILNKL